MTLTKKIMIVAMAAFFGMATTTHSFAADQSAPVESEYDAAKDKARANVGFHHRRKAYGEYLVTEKQNNNQGMQAIAPAAGSEAAVDDKTAKEEAEKLKSTQ